ncbi:MAG: SPOR domain-containing protein [Sphingomonadales bacterium]
MQGFEDVIIQLLLRHNCVVVPGFGGFVAKQVAAELDLQNGLISPPKKALLFNRFLLADDGLLLAEISRQNGLYYEEAKNQLQAYTDQLQRQLLGGESVQFPKLGIFSRQPDGQLHFEQDRFFNLLLSSYGLGKLSFVPQPIEDNAQKPIVSLKEKPVRQISWAKVAAAACLLPLGFYSFWIPTQTTALQSGLISIKDFNPFVTAQKPSYKKLAFEKDTNIDIKASHLDFQPQSKPHIEAYEWQPGFTLNVRVPAVTKKPETTNNTPPINAFVTNAPFHFIVGCFSNLQNAQNFQRKLQRDGFNALLLQNGPLTKVSAGGANDLSELQLIQQQAADRGLQGWVFKN